MKGKVVMALTMCSFLIFLVPFISAEKTVKTIDGYIDYISQTTADQLYWKIITVDPPDGISDVIDAQILVTGDFQAQTGIKAKTQNQFCSPNTWTTPNTDTPNYDITFDCSDIAQNFKGGDINLSFLTTKVAQNVVGTYKMTYYNFPEKTVVVHGTEYQVGDNGKVFLQLLDDSKTPITNSTCYSNIYFPNTTKYVDTSMMSYLEDGIHFYDVMIPEIQGVYIVSAFCHLPQDIDYIHPDNFECGTTNCNASYWEGAWSLNHAEVTTTDSPIDSYHLKTTGLGLDGDFGIVAYYDMDETSGTVMIDKSDNNYNGTHHNTPTLTVDGTRNNATYYNGNNEYSRVVHQSFHDASSSEQIAVCFGIKTSSINGDRIIDGRDSDGFNVQGDSSVDQMEFWIKRTGSSSNIIQSNTYFNDNTWHNVCLFDTLGTMQIWVDGSLDKSESDVNSGNLYFPPDYTFFIGTNEVQSYDFTGSIDEFCYMKGTDMNVSQIAELYESGSCYEIKQNLDNPSNGNATRYVNVTDSVNNDTYWNFWAKAIGFDADSECHYEYYNGSVWTTLLTYDDTDDDNTYRYHSFKIDSYGLAENSAIRLRVDDYTNGMACYIDDIEITHTLQFNITVFEEVFGSGELHISEDFINLSVDLTINTTDTLVTEIWEYENRTTQEEYQLIVSGTEYNSNETGTLYAQFLRTVLGSPNPINNGFCNITVYYPNETIFINNQNMPYISGSNGIYKYNFTVPEIEGVYVADVSCRRGGIRTYSSETFHVGEWANRITTGNITLNVTAEVDLTKVYNNQTKIYNKLLEIQNDIANITCEGECNLSEVIDLINDLNQSIENYVDDHNSSVWNKLFSIQQELQDILDNQGDILNNQTTMYNELTNINIKLTDVLNNQTTLLNYMVSMNSSLYNKMVFLENIMLQINGSLWGKLFLIQDELANITTLITEVGQNVTTTNSSIHTHINDINASIFIKLDEILNALQNISVNTTYLENLILNLNSTLHSHMDANNLTVMTKLYSIQTELQQIINNQQIIITNQTNIYDHITNINQSIFVKLEEILNALQNISVNTTELENLIRNTNQTLYDYMISHNASIWNKLFGIQQELLDIINNQSNIYNHISNINQSIFNKLIDLEVDLSDILANQTTINTHITNVNQSLSNELYYIEELIGNISINTTELENLIKNTNLTIMTKLHGVQDELAQILENQTIIKQMIYDHNTTIYDKLLEVQGNLVYISNQINNTNQTLYDMIYGTNLTIMTKLYGVQDELANITDLINVSINLIYNTNETIMTYLYSMNNSLWSEIYNIWNNLANMTNISMEITANMTTLPREVYLYFQAVEERLVHNNDFCTTNGTIHRKELLIEKCVAGVCWNQTKNIDEVCPYGCVQGACLPTPTIKYSVFIIAILLMLGFMYLMYQIARSV